MAPNWANEIANIRKVYTLNETDQEVSLMSKDTWKRRVKTEIQAKALADLQIECRDQKHAGNLPPYRELVRQQYLDNLPPKLSRKVFHIRTGTVDLRGVRKYMYGDNTECRLCQNEVETVEHVVNGCPEVTRTGQIENIFTTDCEILKEVAKRCVEFDSKVEDKSNAS